jgi:Gpi18-like mannosyltransferase
MGKDGKDDFGRIQKCAKWKLMKNNIQLKNQLINILILWRLALFLVALSAIFALPFKASFPYWETLLEPNWHPIFWSWANFDGVHYLSIAKSGYSAQYTQAFFPLYPLLIGFLSKFVINYLLSGLIISHLSLLGAMYFLYKLVRMDKGETTALRTIIHLILFPTAFFFVSLYSESLFLLLTIASIYCARKQKWWFAGLLAGLASATRVFGIFLLPTLLVEWFQSNKNKMVYSPSTFLSAVFPIFLSSIGLIMYMYYLNKNFSDPLMFLNVQPVFGAERSADKIILIYQVFWRYLKMIITVNPISLLYYTVIQEALISLLFLVLTVLSFKRIRLSYAIFGLLAYFTPTLTGTFSSMPRYVLLLFPSFILLASVKNRRFHRLWWALNAILLAVNLALFVRGYWVA